MVIKFLIYAGGFREKSYIALHCMLPYIEAQLRTSLGIDLVATPELFSKLKNDVTTEIKFLQQLMLHLISVRHLQSYVRFS